MGEEESKLEYLLITETVSGASKRPWRADFFFFFDDPRPPEETEGCPREMVGYFMFDRSETAPCISELGAIFALVFLGLLE